MRFLNLTTAAVAVACFATATVFAQTKPMASPSPASKMDKMPMGKMSKAAQSGKMKTGKMTRKTPMRDPKTGHFISSKDKAPTTSKMSGMSKTGKKMPLRDPKTGRFISNKMKPSPAPK